MSHYNDFYEDSWQEELEGLYKDVHEQQQQDPTLDGYYQLKDVTGKPEGARYCFLPYVQMLAEKRCSNMDKLGAMIENDDTFKSVEKLREMYECIRETDDNETWSLWGDVIAVRYQAIRSGKYLPSSYKKPIDLTLLQDAIARHYMKYILDQEVDEESGCSHLAHIIANILICIAQLKEGEKR